MIVCRCFDRNCYGFTWTDVQMSAVLFIAISGEDGRVHEILSEIAEDAVKDFPKKCRPIP